MAPGPSAVWLLSVDGAPAGFFELRGPEVGAVEIAYFGVLPEYQGRGLGKYLLTPAVQEAWSAGAERVWLHTCTLDHPGALPNYLRRGFRKTGEEVYTPGRAGRGGHPTGVQAPHRRGGALRRRQQLRHHAAESARERLFFINAGAIFVGGIEVKENVSFSYSNQPPIAGQPGLPALTGRANLQLPRSDLIYLDVWLGQVDSAQDPALFNPNDVEMETAVRLIPRWQVRVAEGKNIQAAPLPQIPAPQPVHVHYLLAQLNRTSLVNDQITAPMLVDKRAKNICMFPLLGRVATARASTDLLKKNDLHVYGPKSIKEIILLHTT